MSLGRVQLCDTAGIIISPTTTCLNNKRCKKCKKCPFYNHDPVPVSTFRLWQKNPSRWFQANWTCRLPGRMRSLYSNYSFILVFTISFSGHWLLWESLPPNRDNLCRPENIFAAKSQFLLFLFIFIIIMTLVILGIINIRQISCLSLFHMIILHCDHSGWCAWLQDCAPCQCPLLHWQGDRYDATAVDGDGCDVDTVWFHRSWWRTAQLLVKGRARLRTSSCAGL